MRSLVLRILLLLLALASISLPAAAGSLWKQDVERLVGGDYTVGEIQADLPVYPLYLQSDADAKPELKAYAFETNDLTTVRGYSGRPINILVVMDLNGNFLSAQLLEQKEPLFVRDDDAARLHAYTKQHNGLSLRHTIEVGKSNDTPSRSEQVAHLRGVHTGTITAKAITRTIVSAAANVAIARLKLGGVTPDNGKTSAPAVLPAASLQAATPAEPPKPAQVPVAADKTTAVAVDTSVAAGANRPSLPAAASAATPTAGITGAAAVTAAASKAAPGQQVPPAGTTAAESSSPNASAAAAAPTSTTSAQAAPAAAAPALAALALASSGEPEWLAQWTSRRTEIEILVAGLILLSVALLAQKCFSANARRMRVLRTVYLLFTVGFIGWAAQGQLTIVNITAAIESLSSGGDLSFLMNDPMTVILWVFVGATLLVWGRGTFCGWLCPFGALQELVSLVANAIGVRQRRLRAALDAKLKWVKYGVLAVIIGSLFVAPDFASWAVEVEPFKTAISSYFVRSWPYVLWAAGCLALSVFVYRGYCRYICPLGAALASLGFLRRWSWIARRSSCGTPCQSCRHRCEYQAIDQGGKVNYRECFQCLDCVSIYQDDQRCMPLILEKKRGSQVIPIREVKRA